ncbi:MAG: metalloregulator ArsR/SmtB family transcription factor [Caldilineaceae bacterium]|nr:metalloregulator ArsR/SmtB family transcription factor [Caldilineaceae bacterium]
MQMLLTSIKALADANRLKMLGLLAQAPRSGDELAALLDLKPSTVSHHLARLQKAALVSSTAEQYYHIYRLNEAALEEVRAALAVDTFIKEVNMLEELNHDAFRQQVLARWVREDRLQGLPTPIKQREIVLQWLAEKFMPDQRYGPRQVDDVLDVWCSWADPQQLDITSATRALVDGQQLARTRDGRWFWRTDSPLALADAFQPETLPQADTTKRHVPFQITPLMVLTRLAMRIRANQPFSAGEIDRMIRQHHDATDVDPTVVRKQLVAEKLLQEQAPDEYVRPTIGPDHPASVKLRKDALAQKN